MRAARPAAGPALALLELVARALDVVRPRLRLLHRLDPADPFVAGERGDVLPLGERGVVGDQHLAQIGRDLMNDTVADRPGSHERGRLDPYKLTAAYRVMPALWRPSSARRSCGPPFSPLPSFPARCWSAACPRQGSRAPIQSETRLTNPSSGHS